MTIQSLLSQSGYDVVGLDNRNRAIKGLNTVLANSDIKIKIAPKGKVFVSQKGTRYDFSFSIGDIRYVYPPRPTTNDTKNYSYRILCHMADFLNKEDIKDLIKSQTSVMCDCGKCRGTGFIPQFAWYAKGVCFDCMGFGKLGKYKVNVLSKNANIHIK